MFLVWLERLAFSSVWVAGAAGALCAAAGRALGGSTSTAVVALAAAGTLVVYNVDRLRDVSRDRGTSPRRTAFVERWEPLLRALVGIAAAVSLVLLARLGPAAAAVLLPVAGLGFFHRRLKRFVWWKPFYVSAAWSAVCVGLPAVTLAAPRSIPAVLCIVWLTLFANVVASNLRDGESPSARFGSEVPLRLARSVAGIALFLALLSAPPVRSLLFVPLATLAALAPFHASERYGLIVVDGALLLGALVAACGAGAV